MTSWVRFRSTVVGIRLDVVVGRRGAMNGATKRATANLPLGAAVTYLGLIVSKRKYGDET